MRNSRRGNMVMADSDISVGHRQKFGNMLHTDPNDNFAEELSFRLSNTSAGSPEDIEFLPPNSSGSDSPYEPSSWDQQSSPLSKSPWQSHVATPPLTDSYSYTGLMGSLVREEGHIYSLAASDDLLYTGSDSKNIRVWKHQKEFCGFKSNSGLVKAIVIADDKIFSGHQDGKIRVWKVSGKNSSVYKRIGTMPSFKAVVKSSMNPSNYVEVRRNRNAVWIKHFDAISSLSLSVDQTLLYSASWDKTIKVWRVSNSKCLESINAHDDAVNSVVAGFDGLVFTGSADGTVKVWRRELQGKGTKHFFSQTLLKQECAVTALAVDRLGSVLYCGSSDGLVNYWDRDKLLCHGGVLRGHKLAVLCLAAAGNLVFSGSADTNICVWKREGKEHTCLSVLTGHSGPVKCLAVEGDREAGGGGGGDPRWIVYSGSLDKSVKIWRVSEEMPPMPNQQQQQQQQQKQQAEGSNSSKACPSAQSFSSQGNNIRMSQRKK